VLVNKCGLFNSKHKRMASIKITFKQHYVSEKGSVSESVTVLPKNESFCRASCITNEESVTPVADTHWVLTCANVLHTSCVLGTVRLLSHKENTRVRKLPLRNARPVWTQLNICMSLTQKRIYHQKEMPMSWWSDISSNNTNSTVKAPAWKSDTSSPGQAIPRFYNTRLFVTVFTKNHTWILCPALNSTSY